MRVEVIVRAAAGISAEGIPHDIPVTLEDPLGDRTVFDGRGQEVPDYTGLPD